MENDVNIKELKDRIYTLRKTLNLSMEKFGNKLSISKSSISGFEKGTTKPSEQTLKFMCKEFNVNYLWLTEGIGEMFETPDTALNDLVMQYDLNEVDTFLIKAYLNMSKEERAEFADVILNKLLTILKQELHTDQKH